MATPVLQLTPGYYASTQTLTITDATPGATIYYTTDGAAPFVNGRFDVGDQLYSGPITISTSEIVVAAATESGYQISDSAVGRYFIGSSKSSFIYTVAGAGTNAYAGDGGPAVFAQLNGPWGVALDSAGNIYVADTGNNVIRKIDAKSGVISTIAGTGIRGETGDGGPATNAQLDSPYSIALDSSGNIFTVAEQSNIIRRIDAASGIVTSIQIANGTTDYFNAFCIAFDPAGNLYMSDGYYGVWKVNQATGNATIVAGTELQSGYSGDSGLATSAKLNGPTGIAFDSKGNLYIADTFNNAVRMVNASGIISTVAGGPSNQPGGDGGPATNAGLVNPGGVTLDSAGNLYVADSYDDEIRLVNTSGIISTIGGYDASYIQAVGGDGDPAASVALFVPTGIVSDPSGNIYFADFGNSRVRKITAPIAPPTTQAQPPVFSLSAGTYTTTQTLTLSDPAPGAAIYVNISSDVPTGQTEGYHGPIDLTGTATVTAIAIAPETLASSPVTATFTITQPPASVITTVAGNGTAGNSGNGGPATAAELGLFGSGVAVDHAGNLYIADAANNVVKMVSASSGNITVVAGTGQKGFSGDNGPATSAEFNAPQAVAVDSAGNLFISDQGNSRVREVSAASGIITTVAGSGGRTLTNWGDGGLATSADIVPFGIAVDQKGNLYIAATFHVSRVNLASGIINTIAGSLTASGLGDGGPALNASLYPQDVAVDASGNVFVADSGNGRVREVNAATGIITTVAGNGDFGVNAPGVLATNAEVEIGEGIAVDASDNVYFSTYPVVQKVDAATGLLSTVAGNTFDEFNGDGISATVAGLSDPIGLALDGSGNLYIADDYAARVRKVVLSEPAPVPTFSLAAGTYGGLQSVSISDTATGATIYYTADGSTPTTSSTAYSGPITVSSSETIRAIAAGAGYGQSAVASAAYVILTVPTIALTSSVNPAGVGQAVTFTATVNSAAGTPTGTVAFFDGTTKLGTGTLAAGVATYATSSLAVGAHSITAQYSGDANFAAVTSAAFGETVVALSIGPAAGAPTTGTGAPGGLVTYTLSVTPPGTSAVTFAITGLPAGFTATFTPNTVAAGAGPTDIELTINIPAQAVSAAQAPARPGSPSRLPLALGLLLLPLLGVGRRGRRLSRLMVIVMLAAVGLVAMAGLSGCSHQFASYTNANGNPPPPGSYALTVTATAGSATQSTNLTLNVE